MLRILLRTGLFLVVLAVAFVVIMKVRYGGETIPFPDRSTEPMLPSSALEVVAKLDEPPGNIAVSKSGRVFITFHPEGNPEGVKVAELVRGKPVPFPSVDFQKPRARGEPYFDTAFSVRIDNDNRLWTLDSGFHGFRTARLLAFDLDSRQLVHQWDMPRDEAGLGSYLQDFQVSHDGRFVFLADFSAIALSPALVVYDVEKKDGRRVLRDEPSVTAANFAIRAYGHEMSFLNGLYKMHPGVDWIALDHRDV